MKKNLFNFIFISFFILSILFFYLNEIKFSNLEYFSVNINYNYLFLRKLSIILIILSFVFIFLNTNLKINILLVFFSTFIVIFLIEFVISIKIFIDTNSNKRFDIVKNNISRYEYFIKLKNSNINPVFSIHALNHSGKKDIYNLFSLGGISNKITIDCNDNGYWSTFKSDRYGFNNIDSDWDKNIDFLLVGDSHLYGSCVNQKDTIGSVLKEISGSSVISLANRGNGPLIQYALLKEYGKLFKPNKILWFYFEGNDNNDLLKELKNPILFKYLEDEAFSQQLTNNQLAIDNKLQKIHLKLLKNIENNSKSIDNKNYIDIFFTSLNFSALRHLVGNFIADLTSKNKFKQILNLANRFSEKLGAKLYVVYLPDPKKNLNNLENKNYKTILKIAKELEIQIIDLNEEIYKNNYDVHKFYTSINHTHPNILGYKTIANAVFEKVLQLEKN